MGVALHQGGAHFLEVQHPERKAEIVQVDRLHQPAKGAGIFVVDVQDHHMGMVMFGQQPLQNAGDGAGLARTGRTHDQEMLGQQFIGQQARGNAVFLEQGADLDAGGLGRGINPRQVMLVGHQHRITQSGHAGNAAAESETPIVIGLHLAGNVELDQAG